LLGLTSSFRAGSTCKPFQFNIWIWQKLLASPCISGSTTLLDPIWSIFQTLNWVLGVDFSAVLQHINHFSTAAIASLFTAPLIYQKQPYLRRKLTGMRFSNNLNFFIKQSPLPRSCWDRGSQTFQMLISNRVAVPGSIAF
jgi:hypothetical protein